MKILTVNEIESGNIGDQSIALGLSKSVKTVFGEETEVYHFSVQKGLLVEKYQTKCSKTTISDSGDLVASSLYHLAWTLRYVFRLCFVITTIAKVDLIIIGGGSLIMNNRLQFPTALYLIGLLSRLLRKPYAVTGVSLSGAIEGVALLLFRRFLKGAVHIDMRDPLSRKKGENLFSVSIASGSDYAFALDEDRSEDACKVKRLRILVNISSAVKDDGPYLYAIRALINKNGGESVGLVTTGDIGDIGLTNLLAEELRVSKHNVFHPRDYLEFCAIAATAEIVVATRLHAGILGLLSRSATYVLDVGYKQRGMFLGLGLGSRILSYDSADDLASYVQSSTPNSDHLIRSQSEICLSSLLKIRNLVQSDAPR